LLQEILSEPQRLTRQRFVGPWGCRASRAWAGVLLRDFAGKVGEYLKRQLAELRKLGDIHTAIDTIGSVFWKYSLLLTGSSYATLEPVIQDPWEEIFHMPWIVDRDSP
jgi:hypothetical protein